MIVNDTGQYPYFIQFYCNEIVEMVDKKTITVKDYVRIKPVILKQLDSGFFDARFEDTSAVEIDILKSMAGIAGKDIQFGEIADASGVRRQALSRHLARLERKGILHSHKRGAYRFSVPMLREYIVRRSMQDDA